jgi:hypothetical protein
MTPEILFKTMTKEFFNRIGTKQSLAQHLLPLQHPQSPSHAEPGHVARHTAQPSLAAASAQVHMQPRHIILQEAFQKTRREDVIGLAIQSALFDVGDL